MEGIYKIATINPPESKLKFNSSVTYCGKLCHSPNTYGLEYMDMIVHKPLAIECISSVQNMQITLFGSDYANIHTVECYASNLKEFEECAPIGGHHLQQHVKLLSFTCLAIRSTKCKGQEI